MTRNYIGWYFGNLHINLDPIKFWHIIFPNVRKCYLIIVYLGISVPRYKCTNMFKTLCNWTIHWDPHF